MRILMLSDFYPPVIGGMERHVQLLSEELTKRGHRVAVCTTHNRNFPSFNIENGVEVFRFRGFFQRMPFLFKSSERRYHPPIRDWMVTKKLEKVIEIEKPDIIHAHGWITYSVLPLKKKFCVPLIVTLHDYGFICPMRAPNRLCNRPFATKCISCGRESYGLMKSFFSYYGVKLNREKLCLVDKFIAVSSFVRQVYSKHLSLEKKIIVIPNFCEIKKENLKSKQPGIFTDDFILFVGSLGPYKGVNVLIDAYNRLNTETKLVLIGRTHPDFSYKGTEKIIIIKNVPHEIVMDAFSKCKFAVIPSICPETFGLVALEAMSCKKAIIASNIGGLSDIIVNRKTGILIPSNNSKKLAEVMDYLLKKPSTANEMGENGFKRFMRSYTSGVVIPKIEKIYANLCDKRD